MSKRISITITAIAIAMVSSLVMAGDVAWFNPSKCAMCMSYAKVPGLMEATNCEELNISNGIVCVTNVDAAHLKAYRDAHSQMMDAVARVEKGEPVDMCGSCTALSEIMKKGVKQDYAQTKQGDVWIVTSDSPAVSAELQAWAKRNNEEMAKMKMPATKAAKM